jgi:competence protein ComEA
MQVSNATLLKLRAVRWRLKQAYAALMLAALVGLAGAVEVNQANEAELDGVRGFGPPTTARILQERAKAPFADWADLMRRVKGIKDARARQLSSEGMTVNGQPYPSP